jgi:hypothetical protein
MRCKSALDSPGHDCPVHCYVYRRYTRVYRRSAVLLAQYATQSQFVNTVLRCHIINKMMMMTMMI